VPSRPAQTVWPSKARRWRRSHTAARDCGPCPPVGASGAPVVLRPGVFALSLVQRPRLAGATGPPVAAVRRGGLRPRWCERCAPVVPCRPCGRTPGPPRQRHRRAAACQGGRAPACPPGRAQARGVRPAWPSSRWLAHTPRAPRTWEGRLAYPSSCRGHGGGVPRHTRAGCGREPRPVRGCLATSHPLPIQN